MSARALLTRSRLGTGSGRAADTGGRALGLRDRGSRSRNRGALGGAAVDRLAGDDLFDLIAAQGLIFEQRRRELLELIAVLVEQMLGARIAVLDNLADFL